MIPEHFFLENASRAGPRIDRAILKTEMFIRRILFGDTTLMFRPADCRVVFEESGRFPGGERVSRLSRVLY